MHASIHASVPHSLMVSTIHKISLKAERELVGVLAAGSISVCVHHAPLVLYLLLEPD